MVSPEPSSQLGVRRDADADHDEVDVEHGTIGEPDALDAVAALDEDDTDAEPHVHAVVAVDVGDDRAHLGAEPPLERHGQRLDEADVDPAPTAGGRHLGADEPGADDRDPARATASSAARISRQSSSVRKRVHAVEVVGAGQPLGRRAGGDHQPVEAEPLTAAEQHGAFGEVEPGGRLARAATRDRGRRACPLTTASSVDSGGFVPASTCFDSGGRS